jgi:DNA-binding transcriptional LysR family regulator
MDNRSVHLHDIAVFTKVADAGSFTAAARALDMPKSTVSRRVANLEEALGVRLLHRTTRKVRLTDDGRAYAERCRRAIADLDEAERLLTARRAEPRGTLRVTAPVDFGEQYLGPIVAEYLRRHEDVRVEVELTPRVVDLVEEGFDVAIRLGALPPSALIARRLRGGGAHLYASPRYLARRGAPRTVDDLARHDCIAFRRGGRTSWTLQGPSGERTIERPARLVVNHLPLAREAAVAGLGIAVLPGYLGEDAVRAGRLRRVLSRWATADTPVHAVYPSARQLSAKVRAFLDLLVERFKPAP